MNENDFKLLIQTVLDKSGAQKNISDLQDFLNKNVIKIIPQLDSTTLKNNLKTISGDLAKALNSQFGTNISKNDVFKLLNQQLNNASKSSRRLVTDLQKITQVNTITTWASNNTKALKQNEAAINSMISKLSSIDDMTRDDFNNLKQQFKEIQVHARETRNLGLTFGEKLNNAWSKFGGWTLASSSLMFAVSKTKEAVGELKEIDNILTEISKTSDLTKQELKSLGTSSYDAASKYGRTASDYLTGIQEMSRSGFYGKQSEAMAEQSLLAQAAGDLSPDIANKYILATNAAYKLNGEASKLNAVLDGQNSITNQNSVAMSDMATAMSEAGTTASAYRVSIEDLSAMIGTIESVTKLGGGEVGNAIKAILINLQNVTSSKIVDTLDAANASMTEMVDGAEKLRNPIAILRDLAKTFNELDEDDPLRAEILTNIGQKYHATKLSALLQNMDMFDKQLGDYAEGSGSAMREAEKSASNWTGALNKTKNAWVELIDSLTNQDVIITAINGFTGLLNTITALTDKFGTLSTLSGIGGSFLLGKKGLD